MTCFNSFLLLIQVCLHPLKCLKNTKYWFKHIAIQINLLAIKFSLTLTNNNAVSDWPADTCPAPVSSAEAALEVDLWCSGHWDRSAVNLNTVVKASGPNPAEPHVHAAPSPVHETTAQHCWILHKEAAKERWRVNLSYLWPCQGPSVLFYCYYGT